MKFAVFDLEASNWTNLLIGGFYYKDENDKEFYHEFYTIEDFLELLFSSSNNITTCYAHFGGIYDFLFIIDCVFSQNTDVWEPPKNLIVQGKKILKFDLKRLGTKRSITFVCSSGLFPFKLSTLTKAFGVQHLKLDMDVSNLKKVTKKLKKYLKHDCIGLYECLEIFSKSQYINQVGLSLTRSGQAFSVFTKLFHQEKLPYLSKEIKDFARKSYFGGRTEIFKPLHKLQKGKLHVYDINSLYPSVMRANDFPSNFIGYTDELDLETFSIYHCVVTCPSDLYIPLLPIKHKVNKTEKLIFPTGTFEGYWTNVELKKAIELGYTVDEIIEGTLFDNGGPIFKEYVDHFYKIKKNSSDPVMIIIAKDLLNHLYGRIGMNPDRKSITFDREKGEQIHSVLDYGDYEIRLYSYDKYLYSYNNPVIPSFVTAYSRVALYECFEKVNFEVYYCDTDSIHTKRKMRTSKALGKLKLEDEWDEKCYLVPKGYAGRTKMPDGSVYEEFKLKGVPEYAIKASNISFDDFVESISGEMRLPEFKIKGGLAGLKTAMKKGEFLHVLEDSTRSLSSKYDKRILIKSKKYDYDTIPINLKYKDGLNV